MVTPQPMPSVMEAFFDHALPRIRKFLLGLAIAGLVVCSLLFRWPVTAGFLVGALISYVNQLWLEARCRCTGRANYN